MYVRRKNKSIYIVLIMITLICITIGYAVINTTLNINGRSNISKNTWDVYFDNVVVKEDSVEAVKIPTVTDKTTVDFEVALNLPGDFYEFTVDVVNNGTIDAMIESVNKTPNLTTEQQKYLDYIISYQNGEQITTKHLVKANEFVRLKVRVEYKSDLTAADLPTTTEILNLGFTVNHIQNDGSGISVPGNGLIKVATASGSLDEIGTIVTIDTEQFYTIGTDGDNVKLLSMYNLYVGNECPSNSANSLCTSCTPYGDKATGKQDSTMIGYVAGQSISKGTTSISDSSKYYTGSIVEGYVNNYNNYLITQGVSPIKARLITKDELISLGCSISSYSCSNAPSWVYATSYWTGSVGDSTFVWYVNSDGKFYNKFYGTCIEMGVRPVIVMKKSDIVVDVKPVANGDINEIGTIVTIGDQQFYTIGTEGENVKLLSMYNLYVGGEWDTITQVWTAYGSEATGKQDSTMLGDVSGQSVIKKGTTAFSSDTQKGKNYSDYNGSIVKRYVNAYKDILESEEYGVSVVEARLITEEELTSNDIGCSADNRSCYNAPSFIYSTTYWSGWAYSSDGVWFVYKSGAFGYTSYNDYAKGVRPVIIISKSYF